MRRALVPLLLVPAGCGHHPAAQPVAEPPARTAPAPSAHAAPARVLVPPAVGWQAAPAGSRLRAAGFRVRTSAVASPLADGTVLRQLPGAGAPARRGSVVSLLVSRQVSDARPNQAVVPGVVGLARDEAVARLEAAQLRASAPAGLRVVRTQAPPPGTRLLRASVVRLG